MPGAWSAVEPEKGGWCAGMIEHRPEEEDCLYTEAHQAASALSAAIFGPSVSHEHVWIKWRSEDDSSWRNEARYVSPSQLARGDHRPTKCSPRSVRREVFAATNSAAWASRSRRRSTISPAAGPPTAGPPTAALLFSASSRPSPAASPSLAVQLSARSRKSAAAGRYHCLPPAVAAAD